MSEKPLEHKLTDYYQSKNLPEDKLVRLTQMIREGKKGSSDITPGFIERCRVLIYHIGFKPIPRFAVILSCLLILSFVVWQVIFDRNLSDAAIQTAVVKEITMNHRKNLAPEFTNIPISALGRSMSKLDFTPVTPVLVKNMKMEFKGARYCSIQGSLAVQMKFEMPSGEICTLYQTQLVKTLSLIPQSRVETSGLEVRLWHEKGLFMGMAGASDLFHQNSMSL